MMRVPPPTYEDRNGDRHLVTPFWDLTVRRGSVVSTPTPLGAFVLSLLPRLRHRLTVWRLTRRARSRKDPE